MRVMRIRSISFPENVAYVPNGQMDDPCSVTKYEKTTSYLNLVLPCGYVGGITYPGVSEEKWILDELPWSKHLVIFDVISLVLHYHLKK